MKIELNKKVKGATLIEGFPGLGLVGTITTEFLIDHLNAKQIGKIICEDITPMVAVHDSKVVEPLGIFYDEKNNLLILHALISVSGLEWKLADIIAKLCGELEVKEVICIEGVSSPSASEETKAFFYSKDEEKWKDTGSSKLKEGIVIGVTGALILNEKLPVSCIFAETHSSLPDSRAAAKIIEVLDKYLKLDVDYQPLIKKAEEFENKLRHILTEGRKASELKKEKDLNYVG